MPAEKAPELPQGPEHQEKSLGLDPFSPLASARVPAKEGGERDEGQGKGGQGRED